MNTKGRKMNMADGMCKQAQSQSWMYQVETCLKPVTRGKKDNTR